MKRPCDVDERFLGVPEWTGCDTSSDVSEWEATKDDTPPCMLGGGAMSLGGEAPT